MSEPTLDPAAMIGRTFADGRYRLVREIGSGAMGSVYEAVHEALGRTVAIKLLHPEMMQRPRYADRFRREARAASLLRHRNSVQLLDFGNDGPFFYLVMEYLNGRTLGEVIDAEGPLPASRAIHVMAQVCAALGAAHDQSIVHRDIKPSNILLTPWIDDDGRPSELVKVLDFGIAKIQSHEDDDPVDRTLTLEGDVCGTPEYMSPEQAEGRKLDNRSDLYACGIVLFHMLTGDVPFYGDTPLATMVKQVAATPPSPSALNAAVSPELEAIVLRCLAKKRDERFPTVRALRTALLRLPEAAPAPGIISDHELAPVRGTDTTATAPAAGLAPTT
ncbi:MAG: serine/threonine protein kinase, partial [Deltaproteobacteria bacterium]